MFKLMVMNIVVFRASFNVDSSVVVRVSVMAKVRARAIIRAKVRFRLIFMYRIRVTVMVRIG